MPETDARVALLHDWLSRALGLRVARIEPASSDASFRRYFRVWADGVTHVAMDAPPAHEDVGPYLKVSALLEPLGIHVPHVRAADAARGFVLLEDLGSTPYLERLARAEEVERLYDDALAALATLQSRGGEAARELRPYDEVELAREMALLPVWFLDRHLGLGAGGAGEGTLAEAEAFLIREALAQPQVFVHRDYHSRNLMVVAERNPGVIDFQDAVRGPVGYDLVSLLKDCYIAWPRERVVGWVRAYRERLRALGGPGGASEGEFLRGFDLIGVQRHLKVLGIFCRLWYRDGKPGYLADLPRTLDYVREVCARYAELARLGRFLEAEVAPRLPQAHARALASGRADGGRA